MVTFTFLCDLLKQSIPRLLRSPEPSSLSSFQARVQLAKVECFEKLLNLRHLKPYATSQSSCQHLSAVVDWQIRSYFTLQI